MNDGRNSNVLRKCERNCFKRTKWKNKSFPVTSSERICIWTLEKNFSSLPTNIFFYRKKFFFQSGKKKTIFLFSFVSCWADQVFFSLRVNKSTKSFFDRSCSALTKKFEVFLLSQSHHWPAAHLIKLRYDVRLVILVLNCLFFAHWYIMIDTFKFFKWWR